MNKLPGQAQRQFDHVPHYIGKEEKIAIQPVSNSAFQQGQKHNAESKRKDSTQRRRDSEEKQQRAISDEEEQIRADLIRVVFATGR